MIKPVKMQKMTAVILDDKRDAVLRELKERGAIQFLKVEEVDELEGFDLSPGRPKGINAKAGEHLAKVEGMLDVFKLAKEKEETSLLKKLTAEPVKPVETEETSPDELFDKVNRKLADLGEKVFAISARLEELKKEREEVAEAEDVLEKLKPLGLGPADLEGFTEVFTATGVIATDELEEFQKDLAEITDLCYIHTVPHNKTHSIILVVAPREFEADLKRTMHIHRFEEFRAPASFADLTLEEAQEMVVTKTAQIDEEEEKLLAEVKELKDAEEKELLLTQEILKIEKTLDEVNAYFGSTQSTVLLRGWVPVDRVEEVKGIIERESENHCIVAVEEPKEHEEHPPTLLYNSWLAKPMELLTNTYGVPSYGKTDPSLMMALSFPILFGLMFGDAGQGLVLVILGYLMGFRLKLDEGTKRLGRILFYCGIFATLAGFLYGEFFGLEGIVPALWLRPLESVDTLITFAFYIALVQLTLGCLINIYDELSHGKPLHAIFSPWGVVGLWLFWGGAYVLHSNGVNGLINIAFGFFGADTIASSVKALGLPFFVPVGMIILGGKFVEGLSIPWSIYEAYEAVTRFLFNSISYIRVSALAVVHAVFNMLMLMAMGASPTPLNAVVFILGNTFIIVFEALISFIQSLRLHYYEWFSKFYTGEGEMFKPFIVERIYTVPVRANGKI
ncbi:MAG: hypothetical protein GXO65_07045 [Euryarchaeota archaeon]|nr:hypothetical protein [Euryarchaeota archaeon]